MSVQIVFRQLLPALLLADTKTSLKVCLSPFNYSAVAVADTGALATCL